MAHAPLFEAAVSAGGEGLDAKAAEAGHDSVFEDFWLLGWLSHRREIDAGGVDDDKLAFRIAKKMHPSSRAYDYARLSSIMESPRARIATG